MTNFDQRRKFLTCHKIIGRKKNRLSISKQGANKPKPRYSYSNSQTILLSHEPKQNYINRFSGIINNKCLYKRMRSDFLGVTASTDKIFKTIHLTNISSIA